MTIQNTLDDLAKSSDAEQVAWDAVKNKLPGSKNHCPVQWEHWLQAVANRNRSDELARAARTQKNHPNWYG